MYLNAIYSCFRVFSIVFKYLFYYLTVCNPIIIVFHILNLYINVLCHSIFHRRILRARKIETFESFVPQHGYNKLAVCIAICNKIELNQSIILIIWVQFYIAFCINYFDMFYFCVIICLNYFI